MTENCGCSGCLSLVYTKISLLFVGIPDTNGFRSLCWKLLFGYLSPKRADWSCLLKKKREVYRQLISKWLCDRKLFSRFFRVFSKHFFLWQMKWLFHRAATMTTNVQIILWVMVQKVLGVYFSKITNFCYKSTKTFDVCVQTFHFFSK